MDYIRRKKEKGLVFKVDFDKAYDNVEWEFLFDSMTKMGFGTKLVKWIKACLQYASTEILTNGSPTKEFDMEKGLRQDDPLAPFLFTIVTESLHLLMEEAAKSGMYEGLKVGMKEIQVSHQYADDVIFFLENGALATLRRYSKSSSVSIFYRA